MSRSRCGTVSDCVILLRECDDLFFFSSRRRHTRFDCDWSSDVCSSDLKEQRRSPIVPQPREPNPQDSISPTETELMTAVRTLQDQKLMSESKNLCLQKGTSPETISQRQK